MVPTSNNGAVKVWAPVCIPYHYVVDGVTSNSFLSYPPWYKYPTENAQRLTWNSRRALLNIVSFSKLDDDGTSQEKPCNVNALLQLNSTP